MFTTNSTLTKNIFNEEKLAGYTLVSFFNAGGQKCNELCLTVFTPKKDMIQWAPDYSELYIQVFFEEYNKVCAKLAITTKDNSVYLFEELDKVVCDKHRDILNDAIVKLQNSINKFRRDRPFHTTNYRTPDPRYTEFYIKTK